MIQNMQHASVIDVRTPGEFEMEHYPNAINIPLDQVLQRLEELKQLPKSIVAYCKSGNRSAMAVNILQQHGVTEVMNGGGLQDLQQAG